MKQTTGFWRAVSRLLAVVAVLALTAGSCDGDTVTVGSEESEAAAQATEADSQAGEDAEPTSTTVVEVSSDQDDVMFCEAAAAVEATTETIGIDMTPEELEQALNDAQDQMEAAIKSAPDDIRPAVETSSEAFALLAAEVAKAGYSMLDVDLAAMDAIDSEPRFGAADDELALYMFEDCGIGTDPALDLETDDETPLPEGSVRDLLITQFVEAGFTQEEAECLAEQPNLETVITGGDLAAMTTLFEECGISLDRLAQLGG